MRRSKGYRAFRRASKSSRAALGIVLAFILCMPLAGCKDTDVLTQKIIGEVGQYEIDYSVAPVSLDDPNSSDSHSSDYEQQSDRVDDTEENTPQYDDETTVDEEVAQQNQATTPNDDTASSGNDEGSGTGGSGKAGAGDATGEEGDGEGQVIGIAGTGEDGENEDSDLVDPSEGDGKQDSTKDPDDTGVGQNGVIVPAGNYGSMPPSDGVAAANYLGLIVQALCGEGGLKYTNSSWVNDLPAQAFGNKQEFGSTVVSGTWGDGSTMTDAVVQEIIDSGADTYLYTLNCGYINEGTQQTLSEAGINVIELNVMNVNDVLDASISQNVQVIGALLEDSGCQVNGMNPRQMAAEWQSEHDYAIESSVQANGGYAVTISRGVTRAKVYQGVSTATSAEVASERTRSYTMYVRAFADEPTPYETLVGSTEPSILERERTDLSRYMWPYGDYCNLEEQVHVDMSCGYAAVGGAPSGLVSSAYTLKSYYLQCAGVAMMRPYNVRLSAADGTSKVSTGLRVGDKSQFAYPGTDDYLAVIAEDADVARTIAESASIADRSSKTVGLFNTGSPYRIYVMPHGVAGTWANGTFESFLLAPWALYVYQDNIDMGNINNIVNQFYQTFYRTSAGGILDAEQFGDGTTCWGGYLMATCPHD